MSALTAADLSEIAAALHDERVRLLESVGAISRDDEQLASSQTSGEFRVRDFSDGDVLAVERALLAQLGDTARSALTEIDAALARLAAGTYGMCGGCGKQIPPARLRVRPRTSVCVPCAS